MRAGWPGPRSPAAWSSSTVAGALGTEALEALIAYCRTMREVRTILADTEVENKVSQRVLEKSGFTFIRADSELCFYRLTL
jgi:hypothetical protein